MTQVTIGCMNCDWEKTVDESEAQDGGWKQKMCESGCDETLFYFVD